MPVLFGWGIESEHVLAEVGGTPEDNEPSTSSSHRSGRRQSAPLWGEQQPRENPKKERMVSLNPLFPSSQLLCRSWFAPDAPPKVSTSHVEDIAVGMQQEMLR